MEITEFLKIMRKTKLKEIKKLRIQIFLSFLHSSNEKRIHREAGKTPTPTLATAIAGI